MPHVCAEEDTILNSRRTLLDFSAITKLSLTRGFCLIDGNVILLRCYLNLCGLGVWHQLSDCKRGLEAQTGNENCTGCHSTQIDSFTVFKGREQH